MQAYATLVQLSWCQPSEECLLLLVHVISLVQEQPQMPAMPAGELRSSPLLLGSLIAACISTAAHPFCACLHAGAKNTPYMLPNTHLLISRSLATLTRAQGNAAAAQKQLQQLRQTLQEGHEPEPYWLAGDLSSLALEQGDAEVRAAACT